MMRLSHRKLLFLVLVPVLWAGITLIINNRVDATIFCTSDDPPECFDTTTGTWSAGTGSTTSGSGSTTLGPGSFNCSCNCNTGAGTGCSCSCDIDVPLPLPVYIYQNNAPGVEVEMKNDIGKPLPVYDEKVYKVLYGYLSPQGELPRGEETKIALAQKVQGNIMRFITNKSDIICPENEKFPDTDTCRRGVENWATVIKDVEDNAKRVFYNDLAKLNPDVIPDIMDKQLLVDMLGLVVDRNPVGNLIESYIKKAYNSEPFHVDSTSETGAFAMESVHANKSKLFAGIQQYFTSYVQEMKDSTKFTAELGGGWFGSWECVREIYDPVTDKWGCDPNGGHSYIITPGQMNTIANVLLPTLDIQAAMNSTYFTAMYDKYARLRIDSDTGYITQGLLTDQALYQDQKNRLGFMMPGSLSQMTITPSCQIRVWPAEQLTLFTEGDNHQENITFDVYLSNADKAFTTVTLHNDTGAPGIVSFNEPAEVDNGIYTQYTAISTFTGNSAGQATVKAIANVKRVNDDGSEATGSCETDIQVTVLPDIECSIALTEAPSGILSLTNAAEIGSGMDWTNKDLLNPKYYPKIKKDLNFTVTATGDAGLLDIAQLLFSNFSTSLTNTKPIHNRIFSLTKPLISLLPGRRILELNDLGTATIHTEVKFLGISKPLCEADFDLRAGKRCSVAACPHQRGPDIADSKPMVRVDNGGTCSTAYCDYHTGVRTSDYNDYNAYCIDICP